MSGLNTNMTGPPPSQNRRRRNATVPMTPLPADGYQGEIPEWPLGPDIVTQAKLEVAQDKVTHLEGLKAIGVPVSESTLTRAKERLRELELVVAIQHDAELALWNELWRTPQADQWHRLRWLREVAQYVRHKVLGESGDLDQAKEARQLGDRLGLTPMAMLRLRWEVAEAYRRPVAAPAPTADGTVAPVADIATRQSRRQRLS